MWACSLVCRSSRGVVCWSLRGVISCSRGAQDESTPFTIRATEAAACSADLLLLDLTTGAKDMTTGSALKGYGRQEWWYEGPSQKCLPKTGRVSVVSNPHCRFEQSILAPFHLQMWTLVIETSTTLESHQLYYKQVQGGFGSCRNWKTVMVGVCSTKEQTSTTPRELTWVMWDIDILSCNEHFVPFCFLTRSGAILLDKLKK